MVGHRVRLVLLDKAGALAGGCSTTVDPIALKGPLPLLLQAWA